MSTRSVIALDDGIPVAAGIIWTSRAHGDRYWVAVVVDPIRRRQGVGTAVVAALAAREASSVALTIRVRSPRSASCSPVIRPRCADMEGI